jgi:hypothetical protein
MAMTWLKARYLERQQFLIRAIALLEFRSAYAISLAITPKIKPNQLQSNVQDIKLYCVHYCCR